MRRADEVICMLTSPTRAAIDDARAQDSRSGESRWSLTLRTMVIFGAIDAAFTLLIVPAYVFMVGTRASVDTAQCWLLACLLCSTASTTWLAVLSRLTQAGDRVPDGDDEVLARSHSLHRFPTRSAALWSVKWVSTIGTFAALAGDLRSPAASVLFLAAMALGPLPLAHSLSLWLSRREVGRVSLLAHRRKLEIDATPTSLSRRLVLHSLTLAFAPAFYLSSMIMSPRAQQLPTASQAWLVGLMFAAVALFALMCALLFAATIAEPLTLLNRVITDVGRQREVLEIPRVPQLQHDEIGDLVANTNRMLERLENSERERADALSTLRGLNQTLEQRVEERTLRLRQANAALDREVQAHSRSNGAMRMVLNSVGQGFLMADEHGNVAEQRSAVTEEWFGEVPAAATLWQYLGADDSAFAATLELGWAQLREDVLPRELLLDQLPKRLTAGLRTFALEYRPVAQGLDVARAVILVSDITSLLDAEQAEADTRESLILLDAMAKDRVGVMEFIEESRAIIHELSAGSPSAARLLHTLKGNCSLFGIHSIATLCHRIEDSMGHDGAQLSSADTRDLAHAWRAFEVRVGPFIGSVADHVQISTQHLQELVDSVRSDAPRDALESRLLDLMHEPVGRPLERLGARAKGLAERQGKASLEVRVDAERLHVPPGRWRSFWSAMVHAVRNAVDHGIESVEERRALGKPDGGRMCFRARREDGDVIIEVEDDGRGIDWRRVRERARALGLATDTRAQVCEALFVDGMSTCRDATETSGRGVGLGALLEEARNLGGVLDVESEPGRGTRLRARIPVGAEHGDSRSLRVVTRRHASAEWNRR